ncbi:hypothetical protein [Aliikangiella sp. IMCC44359]|uniref:hypothetical protein n=1 Tax=Aliikangiella sp. IMCC44359 TaxID=3459125 RepID=UPI00403B2A8F
MPKKLTQAERQARNAARKAKLEAGTTTRVLTASVTTGFAYAREFTIKAEEKGGPRRRGLSVGRRETTTNQYENRTTYADGRPTVVTKQPSVSTTTDKERQHSHEAVPAWHTPSGSRRAGDTDTKTYGDVSSGSVRGRVGSDYKAP